LGVELPIKQDHRQRSNVQEVLSVNENTPIEEAARIMADNKIGGLPVVRGEDVVGIITETDLFKIFLELMGAREPGVRVTALIPEQRGQLAKLTQAVANEGGNLLPSVNLQGIQPPADYLHSRLMAYLKKK